MRNGLGIVLTPYGKVAGGYPPYGIAYDRADKNKFLCQYGECDPQFWTRGERGYYYDTPLGAPKLGFFQKLKMRRALKGLGNVPTDFDLSTKYGYTPVYNGWVSTQQGFQTSPWLPPHGEWPQNPNRMVQQVPMQRLNGLGEPASVEDVVDTMNAHNDRVFALTVVSTVAVTTSAIIGIFRTLKLIREQK